MLKFLNPFTLLFVVFGGCVTTMTAAPKAPPLPAEPPATIPAAIVAVDGACPEGGRWVGLKEACLVEDEVYAVGIAPGGISQEHLRRTAALNRAIAKMAGAQAKIVDHRTVAQARCGSGGDFAILVAAPSTAVFGSDMLSRCGEAPEEARVRLASHGESRVEAASLEAVRGSEVRPYAVPTPGEGGGGTAPLFRRLTDEAASAVANHESVVLQMRKDLLACGKQKGPAQQACVSEAIVGVYTGTRETLAAFYMLMEGMMGKGETERLLQIERDRIDKVAGDLVALQGRMDNNDRRDDDQDREIGLIKREKASSSGIHLGVAVEGGMVAAYGSKLSGYGALRPFVRTSSTSVLSFEGRLVLGMGNDSFLIGGSVGPMFRVVTPKGWPDLSLGARGFMLGWGLGAKPPSAAFDVHTVGGEGVAEVKAGAFFVSLYGGPAYAFFPDKAENRVVGGFGVAAGFSTD